MSNSHTPTPHARQHQHDSAMSSQQTPSWRGVQPQESILSAIEWAERLGSSLYSCRVCDWTCHFDGMGYDQLMGVCGHCATHINNLYHRQHSGEWFQRHAASDAELAHYGDSREAPTVAPGGYAKAKISTALRLSVYERDGFKCVYCSAKRNLTLDHVTAESKGGATAVGNLVTCCKTCNSKKRTKTLADFWEASQ